MKKICLVLSALVLALSASTSFAGVDGSTVVKGTIGFDIGAPNTYVVQPPGEGPTCFCSLGEVCGGTSVPNGPLTAYAYSPSETSTCPAVIRSGNVAGDYSKKYRTLKKDSQGVSRCTVSRSAGDYYTLAICVTAYKGDKTIKYACGKSGVCVRLAN